MSPFTVSRALRIAVTPLVVVAVLLSASGCGDHAILGVVTAPGSASTLKGRNPHAIAAQARALAQSPGRLQPLAAPITVTQVVSSLGGTISIPDADLDLFIPAGAFTAATMTISVTALAGSALAYDFQPHGTVFLKGLSIRQGLGRTNWAAFTLKPGFAATVSGAYFADPSQVDANSGVAAIDEWLPAEFNLVNATIGFDIRHFSGYMAAMGRSE